MATRKKLAHGRQRLNGEGTVSGPRKDGRYVGAFYAPTTAGTRKRVYVYGRTREEAHQRLIEEQSKVIAGIPVPDKSWTLGPYLSYWLENVVRPTRRPATYALYEMTVRLHLSPALGGYPLKRLSVPIVQGFLNDRLRAGRSVRSVQIMRQVLSAALSRAVREELVVRNVARYVELPGWEPEEVVPWTSAEALAFLAAARSDPLYPAFCLLLVYGMRRGEVLGLRWQDIDLDGAVIHIRQQVHRSGGELHIGPVKTQASSRDLPLIGLARAALTARQEAQDSDRARLGAAWADTGLVFTTRTGRPVEPRNLVRSFARICAHGQLRRIRVHALRHTAASLLKDLGVPPKDAQVILGHAHVSTTQQIYTHVDAAARRDALTRLNKLLGGSE
ncbi:MAG: tyrosine-type recombinase/integrase [Streptosporangiaceae bacterium]